MRLLKPYKETRPRLFALWVVVPLLVFLLGLLLGNEELARVASAVVGARVVESWFYDLDDREQR